jgi:hypothetical protein
MDLMADINYLCQQLILINKKYESYSFVDIDFIELFNLNLKIDNLNQIKKKITTKYYSLALKYHPDKHTDNNDLVINVVNSFVNITEIKSGEFLAFISDIYQMLLNLIIEDPEVLIKLVNGNTEGILGNFDYNGDFYNLKKRFDSSFNTEYIRPDINQVDEFENKLERISEIKINEEEILSLIEQEKEKRELVKVANIFTETDIETDQFNETFDNIKYNNNEFYSTDILAFNFNKNYELSAGKSSDYATDIDEAFKPININSKIDTKIISYEELLTQRESQDKSFKSSLI